MVHGWPSSHAKAGPAAQLPPMHASGSLHALPSVHAAVLAMCTQPLAELHESSVHGLPSLQPSEGPGVHRLFLQTSPAVQASLSVQAPPVGVCVQPPAASQLSSVQLLPSWQSRPVPGVHTELAHASPEVQALPSSHAPLNAWCVQPDSALQPSVVHGLPSSQPSAVPDLQSPA